MGQECMRGRRVTSERGEGRGGEGREGEERGGEERSRLAFVLLLDASEHSQTTCTSLSFHWQMYCACVML